jgi:hypothetical protein
LIDGLDVLYAVHASWFATVLGNPDGSGVVVYDGDIIVQLPPPGAPGGYGYGMQFCAPFSLHDTLTEVPVYSVTQFTFSWLVVVENENDTKVG